SGTAGTAGRFGRPGRFGATFGRPGVGLPVGVDFSPFAFGFGRPSRPGPVWPPSLLGHRPGSFNAFVKPTSGPPAGFPAIWARRSVQLKNAMKRRSGPWASLVLKLLVVVCPT